MVDKENFRHWLWQLDTDKILHLTLDRADSAHNSLSSEVLLELEEVLVQIQKQPPQALILRSGKDRSFIVGADVSEFTTFTAASEVESYITKAQDLFSKVEQLPLPTIAVIDGPCLGGGLELALACRYRLAVDDETTALGLPEIRLGIHPGFGGTVRSIRQIGALPALQLMLSGRSLNAQQAQRAGLVNAAVPRRVLENAITSLLNERPAKKPLPWTVQMGNLSVVKPILAYILKRKVAAKANPNHYPAPNALLELWQKYGHNSEQMYREEARSVARLITGSAAQNLIRVFFLQTLLKTKPKEAKPIRRVHIIGAGSMGRDIAAWCALQGLQVSLQDLDNKALAAATAAADKLFRKKLKKNHLISAAHDRLMPDPTGLGLAGADLVIEAIVEDLAVKRQLFQSIEPQLRPDAILASNTSSIPLDELAAVLERPQQFLGIHFFNPVAKMPLVEIVAASASAEQVLGSATQFVLQIKHLPLPVKSAPGFLVNRILMPYLMAAVVLVEEGYNPVDIDRAALDFGMPMGPLQLADTIGLDICHSVAKVFTRYFERPIPKILATMLADGRLGVKSGQGFYRYRKDTKTFIWPRWRKGVQQEVLLDRLLQPLLLEAEACLTEGIVTSADLVDAGMIFGTGFAPFTGGPLTYQRQ